MNETQLLQEMTAALQSAPAGKVIFLEGKTDTPVFFALLGVAAPRDGIHHGVLVKALKDVSGSGGTSVRMRVELAAARGYSGIYGVIDGDGRPLGQSSASFDPPHLGPLFIWKAYAIENLLVKTGWPSGWGAAPDWTQMLLDHAPYVALNQIYRDLQAKLDTLHLSKYNRPTLNAPLMTVEEMTRALERDKHLIKEYDVAARFTGEIARFEAIVRSSVDEGHTLVDGKWLVNVFAPGRMGGRWTPQACRDAWIAHASAAGGLPEVRGLWERITGRPA